MGLATLVSATVAAGVDVVGVGVTVLEGCMHMRRLFDLNGIG